MNSLFAAAAEVQSSLQPAGEKFCFIGGVALQRWGEPRLTGQIDWTLIYNELAPLAELRGGNALIARLQKLQKS